MVKSVWPGRLVRGLEHELLVGVYGSQPAELWTLVQVVERLALDAGDGFEGGSLALGAGTHRPGDLVASPQPILADQPFAHVHVAVGGEIAGFPAPQESTPSSGDFEHSQHQEVAEATELFTRCRMAVSP